jgi:MYXO-CTERM domain-containing protein
MANRDDPMVSFRLPCVMIAGGRAHVMDWIERLFHISPDGGNGATETLYVGVAVVVLAGLVVLAMRRRRRSRAPSARRGPRKQP